MTFANPEYFLLLLLLVPLILWHFLFDRKRQPVMRVATTETYRRAPRTPRTALTHVPFFLRMACLALVIAMLARPQSSESFSESETQGINIMMALDMSTSMLTKDFKPNRIEAAKKVAVEFINGRPNDNIGLTVFAGEAYTQCPPTTDHQALLSLFNDVSCDLAANGTISGGTAIGMGLASATARLSELDNGAARVVILISDGANNAGEISPLTAAELAHKNGIRVYTIAVGKTGKVQQPVGLLPNGEYYYQMVDSDLDVATLQSIAKSTNGKYYHADSNEKLRDIYHDIDQLEKTKLQVSSYDRRYEAYMPFALAALICLLLELTLSLTLLRRIPA